MSLFKRNPPAPVTPEDRQRLEMLKERQGVVSRVALGILPMALLFDALATLIIAFTAFAQFSPLAPLVKVWSESTAGLGMYTYLGLQAIVLFAVPVAAVESMLMTFPQLGVIEKRIEAMEHNPSKKIRNQKLPLLKHQRNRVVWYIVLAIVPLLLFRVDYLTSFYKPTMKTVYTNVTTTVKGKKHVTRVPHQVVDGTDWTLVFTLLGAAIDAAAPIISILVLTRMENEGKEIDAQEHAVRVTQNAVVTQIGTVAARLGGGKVTKQQALQIQRGTEGDLVGAINAAVERDVTKRWYTIAEICRDKLHVDADPHGGDYRKVTNIVKRANDNGDEDVVYDESQGRGKWLVAGDAIDRLFADYKASVKKDPTTAKPKAKKKTAKKRFRWSETIQLVSDRKGKKPLDGDQTITPDEVAPQAS